MTRGREGVKNDEKSSDVICECPHLHTIYTFSQKEMYLYSISTFDNPRSTTPNIQYYKKANIVEAAEMASIFQ